MVMPNERATANTVQVTQFPCGCIIHDCSISPCGRHVDFFRQVLNGKPDVNALDKVRALAKGWNKKADSIATTFDDKSDPTAKALWECAEELLAALGGEGRRG